MPYLQSEEHVLLLPQLVTQSSPHWTQRKYGSVSEYCDALGEMPLLQTQENVRVSASQVLASVEELLAEV